MKNRLYFFILSLFLWSLFSCNKEKDIGYVEYVPKIAVEGWIENGTPATVMLTWTAPFDQKMDTAFLLEHVIRSAKVSVSDGEQTEILTLGSNSNYLPPYVYYGTSLKGEIGKSYSLKIEYRDGIISAETCIPEPVALEEIRFEKESPSDTTGYIYIRFLNTSDLYYQIATRVDEKETVFTPCLYGNISSASFGKNEMVSLQVSKGPVLYPQLNFSTYFTVGNTISLKFRTQPKDGYDFWTSWQNEVLNAQNPIFPANTSLKSNISGGVGIWCGYGTYNYTLEKQYLGMFGKLGAELGFDFVIKHLFNK